MANPKHDRSELQQFAIRVENQIKAAKGYGSMERLVCRILTQAKTSPAVKSIMAQKWVEWRYGKATEHLKIDGHIEHTVFDAAKLSDEQLAEAERLVESAQSADPGSDSE